MPPIRIPRTLEDAKAHLAGLGALLTAAEWQRAAIVYAFTKDGRNAASAALSFADFSALEITGLSYRETVARYHRAWAKAVEDGFATPVKPGDVVSLPSIEWPPDSKVAEMAPERRAAVEVEAARVGVGPNKVADVVNNPKAVEAAIAASPAVAEAAERALDQRVVAGMRESASEARAGMSDAERAGEGQARAEARSDLRAATWGNVTSVVVDARVKLAEALRLMRALVEAGASADDDPVEVERLRSHFDRLVMGVSAGRSMLAGGEDFDNAVAAWLEGVES